MAKILRALQGGIESLYRIETQVDIADFLLADEHRAALGPDRLPDEQLLFCEADGQVELGLYVDGRLMERLAANDPSAALDDHNLQDFLLAVEGVSHFVFLSWRAQLERPISAVELELQAEIDKYLVVLLLSWQQSGAPPIGLPDRLFANVRYAPNLDAEERDRYRLANQAAQRYADVLEARFVRPGSIEKLFDEVRRFYRKTLADKLGHIEKLAA